MAGGSAVEELKRQIGLSRQRKLQAFAPCARAMWQEELTSAARMPKGIAIANHTANHIRTLESIICIKLK